MPQVLLVNPSPRKSAQPVKGKAKMATARKKPRTAAQRAATRKLVAMNKARRARPARAARSTPKRRKARRSAAPAQAAPRRSKRRRPISSARAASQAGRVLRYRRPNPIGGLGDFMKNTLMPSAVGGAGALALDVALAALPLPATMKVGPMAPLVKVAGAVGLGMLAGQFLGRKTGEQVAAGALTVTIYNVARTTLNRLSGGRIPGLAMYPDSLGEYVSDAEQLGYTDSGQQVGVMMEPDGSMAGYETGVYR